ncbi:Sodium [Echinococcus multilocularis]|uniref:Sodium n=1 Tax=Echinococcus multilocularis TaxID=6211 RepID=A0A0S4MM26_ECHMU|nr:Sodium [Echinococcus multilocularis]
MAYEHLICKNPRLLSRRGLIKGKRLSLLITASTSGFTSSVKAKRKERAALFVVPQPHFQFVIVGFQGLTMRPLVHLARIELNEIKQLSIFTDVTLRFIDHTLAGIEAIVGSLGRNRLRETISRIDTKFIRRVLQRSPQTPDDKVVKIYEQIALKLHLAAVNPEASAEYLHDLPSSLVKKYFQEEIRANLEVLESKDEEAPFGATTALPPKKKEPRKQHLDVIQNGFDPLV